MAEAIIGAQMRAHNPEPCARLVGPSDRTAVSLTPLPQGVWTISRVPTRLHVSTPTTTSRGMRSHDRVVPAGSIVDCPSIRRVPRHGGSFAGMARP